MQNLYLYVIVFVSARQFWRSSSLARESSARFTVSACFCGQRSSR